MQLKNQSEQKLQCSVANPEELTKQDLQKLEKLNQNYYILNKQSSSRYICYCLDRKKKVFAKLYKQSQNSSLYQDYAQMVAKISKIGHPNFLKYFGKHETEDGYFLFSEYIQGGSLQNKLNTLTLPQIFSICSQLIDVLSYIHQLKIVHRCLSLRKIFITQQHILKINFHQFSCFFQQELSQVMGIPIYMAPQIINSQNYNQKCDVWAAGIIIYQLISKKMILFSAKTMPQLRNQIQKFRDPNFRPAQIQNLNPLWANFIMKFLIHDKNIRPAFKQIKGLPEWKNIELAYQYGYQMICTHLIVNLIQQCDEWLCESSIMLLSQIEDPV